MKNKNITLQQVICDTLQKRYNKTLITITELAHEFDCSVSLINNFIANGSIVPENKAMGNTAVCFSIASVASFLSQTICVA